MDSEEKTELQTRPPVPPAQASPITPHAGEKLVAAAPAPEKRGPGGPTAAETARGAALATNDPGPASGGPSAGAVDGGTEGMTPDAVQRAKQHSSAEINLSKPTAAGYEILEKLGE